MSEIDIKEHEERIEAARKEAAKQAKDEAEQAFKIADEARIKELQAERQRRQAAEDELKRTKGEQDPTTGKDPEKVFEELLDRKEQAEVKVNKEKALAEFKSSVREFSQESDQAGIVFSAFEKELKKFTLEGLKSKEDFSKRFKEVHEFMERKKPTTTNPVSFYPGSNRNIGSDPKDGDNANLSDVEHRVIKDMGWTIERYLKQKSARPHYVESLLKYRS